MSASDDVDYFDPEFDEIQALDAWTWETSDGSILFFSEMSGGHLCNVYFYLRERGFDDCQMPFGLMYEITKRKIYKKIVEVL